MSTNKKQSALKMHTGKSNYGNVPGEAGHEFYKDLWRNYSLAFMQLMKPAHNTHNNTWYAENVYPVLED